METLRLDLHIHTTYSIDGRSKPEDYVRAAKAKGFDGLAITDHDAVGGIKRAEEEGDRLGVLVIPGIEVSTVQGHIIVLGTRELFPSRTPAIEVVEMAKSAGGTMVVAHPYRSYTGVGEEVTFSLDPRIIEIYNGHTGERANRMAGDLARKLSCSMTGGSDAHHSRELGNAYTQVDSEPDVENILDALLRGRSRAVLEEVAPPVFE